MCSHLLSSMSFTEISFLVMDLKWYMHSKSQVGFAKTKLLIHSTQVSSPKLGGLATVATELSLLHFSVASRGERW